MRVSHFLKTAGAVTALCLTATCLTLGTASAASMSPVGVWIDHTGRGAVEIKPCGRRLCGRVVWARSRKDSKKGCGKKIISGLQKVGPRRWDNGRIYSPKRGSTYDLEIKPVSRDKLRLLGYAGSKIFSKTMYWKRAPASLVRCDAPPSAKPDTPIIAKKQPAAQPAPTAKKARTAKTKPAKPAASTKTATVTPTPEIVPPKPARATRKAEKPTTINKPRVASRQPTPEPEPSPGARNSTGDTSTARADDDSSPSADDQDDTEMVDDADQDTVETRPGKKRRTARYRKKKMCTFNAPFVTISYPCKN